MALVTIALYGLGHGFGQLPYMALSKALVTIALYDLGYGFGQLLYMTFGCFLAL